MKKMTSVFAFSSYIQIDDERFWLAEGDRKVRTVMSEGQVIVPLVFFEKALGARIKENGKQADVFFEEHILTVFEGQKAFSVDGGSRIYTAAPRRERGLLCLPVVETALALGLSARQFGQLAVIAPENMLNRLDSQPEELDRLERMTCGIYNAAKFTAEDFLLARDAWRRDLCGDEAINDLSIPGMKNLLEMRDQDSEEMRQRMNRGENIPILFGNEPPTASMDLKTQYDQILRMAQPYGTYGCRGYKSKELLNDILYALDWMHDNMYGAKVLSDESFRSYKIFNWWEWFIGGAYPMMETVMIIAEDVGRDLVEKYVLPISFLRTQMRVGMDPAMPPSRIISMTPLALLTEDRALLQADYLDAQRVLEDHDSGNCMRRDGCNMSHGHPYNILYGTMILDRCAKVMRIMEDSPLAFTMPEKYNYMKMARRAFVPLLYNGHALGMMNGRYMQIQAGAPAAVTVLETLKYLFGMFGEEEDEELYRVFYRNNLPAVRRGLISTLDSEITLEEYRKINVKAQRPEVPKTHIATYAEVQRALTDPAFAGEEKDLGLMWYSGDLCMQRRNRSVMALRMNSSRVPGYESINSQHGDGWYTGDGMLYVYTPDAPEQYGIEWWKGVDKYLMPGTTVEDRERVFAYIEFGKWYVSNQDFVGGVELDGQFITASMDLESCHNDVDEGVPDTGYGGSLPALDCNLTAMKSWFMMDRVTVAIGTRINARDDYDVRTVVENRMLTGPVSEIEINGEALPEDLTEITRDDVRSVFLPRTGGYFFPQGGRVTIRLYEKNGMRFIAFWLEHGRKPEDEKYAYIVMPDARAEECVAYDPNDIEILRNDERVQAVRERHSGLIGVIFREAGTFERITAGQPMIVMLHETDMGLSIAACDPTQKREMFEMSIHGIWNAAFMDERMTAEQAEGSVKLTVSCDPARGRAYCAELVSEQE